MITQCVNVAGVKYAVVEESFIEINGSRNYQGILRSEVLRDNDFKRLKE